MTRSKRYAACALLAVAAVASTASLAQVQRERTQAKSSRSTDREVVACVSRISRYFRADGTQAMRVQFIGESTALSFYPDYMAYVGTVPTLTHAQVQRWEPVLDLLRDAAKQRVKVELRIDGSSNKVESVEVRYHSPC
jgi:hypothetical protein